MYIVSEIVDASVGVWPLTVWLWYFADGWTIICGVLKQSAQLKWNWNKTEITLKQNSLETVSRVHWCFVSVLFQFCFSFMLTVPTVFRRQKSAWSHWLWDLRSTQAENCLGPSLVIDGLVSDFTLRVSVVQTHCLELTSRAVVQSSFSFSFRLFPGLPVTDVVLPKCSFLFIVPDCFLIWEIYRPNDCIIILIIICWVWCTLLILNNAFS